MRSWALLASSLLVGVILCESILRGLGYGPLPRAVLPGSVPEEKHPVMPHPVFGSALQEGFYLRAGGVRVTIDAAGRRSSGPVTVNPRGKVILLGGSFTYGEAVSDEETFAYRLQARYPSVEFRNYGSPGHGTYQALLRFEELWEAGERADLVLYGFIGDHAARNAPDGSRLVGVLEDQSRWGTTMRLQNVGPIRLPFCTPDRNGTVARKVFIAPEPWPGARWSALIGLTQRTFVRQSLRHTEEQQREATRLVLRELNGLVREAGGHLVLINLFTPEEHMKVYRAFLDRTGIQYVHCSFPLMEGMIVQGNGHPNGKMHARYAECIELALADELERIGAAP